MITIQIIGGVVLVLALALAIRELRGRGIDLGSLTLLLVLGILAYITLLPEHFARSLKVLEFSRPLDAFLTIASVSSLLLCLRIYFRLNDMERNITTIVRHVSLEKEPPE